MVVIIIIILEKTENTAEIPGCH